RWPAGARHRAKQVSTPAAGRPTASRGAYLAGGPDRVPDTAIATLVERGQLRVSSRSLPWTGPIPADPFERAVAASAQRGTTTASIRSSMRNSDLMRAFATDLE